MDGLLVYGPGFVEGFVEVIAEVVDVEHEYTGEAFGASVVVECS